MSQPITYSGITTPIDAPLTYVTYTQPQRDVSSPTYPDPTRSQDVIPSFMFLAGSVAFEKDQFGNLIARNRSGGESP